MWNKCMISQCALRLSIRKVRERPTVTQSCSQDKLKAAEWSKTVSNELNCNHLFTPMQNNILMSLAIIQCDVFRVHMTTLYTLFKIWTHE